MKFLFYFLVLQLSCLSLFATDVGLPPGERPVKLKTGFYVADLDFINTSAQSFDARFFLCG